MPILEPPHLRPGSQGFAEWISQVINYYDYLDTIGTGWSYGYSIYNAQSCCITTTESSAIASVAVPWNDGANTCLEYYAGEWQSTPGEHDVTIKLKRDGETIHSCKISNVVTAYEAGFGFYIDHNTDDSSHTYTITVQRSSINDGSAVYLQGAGILAMQR